MAAPIALGLYSIREGLKENFADSVKRIAEMGYVGVEVGNTTFATISPKKAADVLNDAGLQIVSFDTNMPVGETKDKVLDQVGELGCKRVVSGMMPEAFESVTEIKKTCEIFNQAGSNVREHGLAFGIHNHYWEFQRRRTPDEEVQQVDGRPAYDIMVENLSPDIFLELDTYWVKIGGDDPVRVIKAFGNRILHMHIKDGTGARKPHVAVGDGVMDFPAIVDAAGGNTEWMIVELDSCATDIMQAVEKSYRYLTGKGLAYGRKS